MAEPMQTDDPVATAAAGQPKQKQKVDRLTEGRDAPWVEKYRPKTLDDVAAHKEIIDTSGCTHTQAFKCSEVHRSALMLHADRAHGATASIRSNGAACSDARS
jgi:hypothetical protein